MRNLPSLPLRVRTLVLATLAMALPARANGLVSDGGPIRVHAHNVEATVDGRIARIAVEQVFRNESDIEREGVYLFPLPRNAVVGELSLTVGDHTLEGEVLDAAQARSVYEGIVRRHRDPALLEYVGRGLFRARVFPIPAKGDVVVKLAYREVLPQDGGLCTWRYPIADDGLNPLATDVARFDVTVTGERALRTIQSPTHAVTVERVDERTSRVRGSVETFRRRDFVLYIGRSDEDAACTIASGKPGDRPGTFFAVLTPRVPASDRKPVPRDVVYVLDTSGSMAGTKLDQAKQALEQGIAMLREGDRFNVIEFATDVARFRPCLVPASDENRGLATRFVQARGAGGSTALFAAITTALAQFDGTRLPLVVLLTDGRPTVGERNGDAIVAQAIESNRSAARIFTFGVGSDLDVRLLDRLAEKTRGAREYVGLHERIDETVIGFLRRVDRPLLTDLALETEEGIEAIYPREIGDLYAGGEIVLLGRYAKPGPVALTLRGRRGDEAVRFTFRGQLSAEPDGVGLERIWAQRKVAYLLDHVRMHGEEKELVDEIRALATAHAFVTPYTASLAAAEGPRTPESGPLFFTSKDDEANRRRGSGGGGSFRGPNGGAPPGLRLPNDPAAPPPAPEPGVARRTVRRPDPIDESEALRRARSATNVQANAWIREIDGRRFVFTSLLRWVDAAWDGTGEPVAVEAFSDAYFDLLKEHAELARVLALGDRVVFLLEGKVYEVKPGKDAAPAPGESEK